MTTADHSPRSLTADNQLDEQVRIVMGDKIAVGHVVRLDPLNANSRALVVEVNRSQYSTVVALVLIRGDEFVQATVQKTDPLHVVAG